MKAVILAGGFGTRFSEETSIRPKPMIEIGGRPILWHIMNIYSQHGINEFIIALGYKGEVIKEYFLNFHSLMNDLTIDLGDGGCTIHNNKFHPKWKVHLVDTGLNTMTGGRLKRLQKWLEGDKTFMFTYGDGVADVDLKALLDFHNSHGKISTVTTVKSPARFGRIGFNGDQITEFYEKPQDAEGWINGGYFVLNSEIFNYLSGDQDIFEREPIEKLAHDGQMVGYKHYGFWSCMDTLKEKNILEDMWSSGQAPWKVWNF
jgi:glucose-1-phosphate cytidylyltransferase